MTSIGQTLAAAREQSGYTLAEIGDRTRIRQTVLAAMERDDFGPCGGDFYARGHLRAVCRELGIDPAPLIARFNEREAEGAPMPVAPRTEDAPASPDPEPDHREVSAHTPAEEPDEGVRVPAPRYDGFPGHDNDYEYDDYHDNDHSYDHYYGHDHEHPHRSGRAGSHAAPTGARARRRIWPLFVAAFIVLAGVVAGVQAWPERGMTWPSGPLPVFQDTDRSTPEPTPAEQAERPEAESADSRDARAVPDTRDAQRSQEHNGDDVRVRLHAHDRMWIRVTDADGGDVFTGVLTDGSQKDWSHSEELRMHLGNAGAAQVEVNGQRLGAPGPSGESVNLVFDAQGMRTR